jgi:transposase
MNAYSLDLRLKVLNAVDRGIPRREVVRTFGVSMPTIERYLRRRRRSGNLTPRPSPGRTPSICATSEERRALWEQLEENDEATLERHCELWEERGGARVSVSTMSRAVRKLGWTFKKSRWVPQSGMKRSEVLGESM